MKSIRSTFLTIILSAAIIIFLLQSAVSLFQFQKVVVEKVEENLKQVAQEEAAKLNLRFATISKANETLAYNLSSQKKFDVDAIMGVIRRSNAKDDFIFGGGFWLEPNVYQEGVEYYGPFLYKSSEGFRLTWNYSSPEYNYFQHEWYINGLNSVNRAVWSKPFIDNVTGVYMLTSSSAIHQKREIIGVTTLDVRIDSLNKYIESIRVGKTGYALLISNSGQYLGGRLSKNALPEAGKCQGTEGIPSSNSVSRMTILKDKVFATCSPIGETGLKMVVLLPEAEAYGPVKRVLGTYIATLILSLVFLGLLIFSLFNRKINTPVQQLIKAIKQVGQGELEEPIVVRSNDELGMLAQAFEDMRRKLALMVDRLKETNEELAETYEETIRAFYQAIMIREANTAEHSFEVNRIAMEIGKNMDLSEQEMQNLNWGTLLHDIGKLAISDMILLKPSGLDDLEYLTIREHPQIGYDILKKTPYLLKTAEVVRYHHEKFDGTGYPEGLKGEQIPLLARICSVADAFQAMVADRPYRKGRTLQEAVKEIVACSGTCYDPKVVEAFLQLDLNQLLQPGGGGKEQAQTDKN